MRLLVVGSGGREHAVVWKLKRDHPDLALWCVPGNYGISQLASCVPGDISDVEALAAFAAREQIDLTFVGPELPLVKNISNAFAARSLQLVGPSGAAAQLEGSKAFAKEFMARQGISTARFEICDTWEGAERVVSSGKLGFPLVIKASGLAAGKGVAVSRSQQEAHGTLDALMNQRILGDAGDVVVLEEFLAGDECSFLVFTDGQSVLPLPAARDYKRLLDRDHGPNTGGMGSISTPDLLDESTRHMVFSEIVAPTVFGIAREVGPYRGILYVGLMFTASGPKVLEYNARLGDPETQAIFPRLDSDLIEILEAICAGELNRIAPVWSTQATACVVLASKGYPGKYPTNLPIDGLDPVEDLPDVYLFHSGTRSPDGEHVYTSGGRVLGVTAKDASLEGALQRAYRAASLIHFDGMQYRRDIGRDVRAET